MKKFIMLLMLLVVAGCAKETEKKEPEIKMSTIEHSPFGNKSFVVVTVALSEDKIAGVTIKEYTFFKYEDYENVKCVPNAKDPEGLGGNYDSTKVCIGSKNDNDEEYSKKMKELAEATQGWQESITAIEEYAKGKTLEDLKEFDEESDTISGSTLTGNYGYLEAIMAAIEEAE